MISGHGVKYPESSETSFPCVRISVEKDGFHNSDYIVVGNESPVTGVSGVEYVVPGHEEIVMLGPSTKLTLSPNGAIKVFFPRLSLAD